AFAAALAGAPGDAEGQTGTLGGEPRVERPSGRMVPARTAVVVAVVMLVIGLVGGWALARTQGPDAAPTTPQIDASRASTDASPWASHEAQLVVVDRSGRQQRGIPANRPWTPRISPDGRRVAYGAFGSGRNTSDLWVTDFETGTTRRLTDDDSDSNDPQWSRDGASIVYSASADDGKDVLVRPAGGGEARVLARRAGTQFPSDWLRDGSALLVTDEGGRNRRDIVVQPTDGSPAWPYAATPAEETAARVSPDGRWVAYTSDESGQAEVYLDSYPRPIRRVAVSLGGGMHPVWRGDGRELYYWTDGALVAVQLGAASGDAPPPIGARTVLFRAPYQAGPNTMYDVSANGQQFVIVRGL
ncbi:MAG TPA: hypothetical protein VFZ21_04430, partial [Gemmatimonadaceae bacterium]|nr:hypothetical protein [Gemmatimonadaceae bacterium]